MAAKQKGHTMRTSEVTNHQDIIGSRDVIARIAELEGERSDLVDEVEAHQSAYDAAQNGAPDADYDEAELLGKAQSDLEEWDSDNADDLKALKSLESRCSTSEWRHGVTLIRESYFVDYARELCEDIGFVGKDYGPLVIDWQATADSIQQDYTSVEFDGITYLYR